jgi:hypothetical protein
MKQVYYAVQYRNIGKQFRRDWQLCSIVDDWVGRAIFVHKCNAKKYLEEKVKGSTYSEFRMIKVKVKV